MSVTDARAAWEGFTMQLVTRGDWRQCEATRNAAAIAALGVPVAPQKTFRVREGDERVTYLHEPGTVFPHFKPIGPIKEVLRKWRQGELPQTHPFVDARRAISNAEALNRWVKRGVPSALGYDAEHQRTRLTTGEPSSLSPPYAKVASLAKAAALATLGFPVLALEEGDAGTVRFVLTRLSVPMVCEQTPRAYDARELLAGEREETLPPNHPFRIACLAAKTWIELLSVVGDEAAMLMFRSAGTRSAFVHSHADKKTIDRSEAFASNVRR